MIDGILDISAQDEDEEREQDKGPFDRSNSRPTSALVTDHFNRDGLHLHEVRRTDLASRGSTTRKG